MANTDVYVNKITLPKDRSNTYTGILIDTASQKPWFGTSSTSASTATKLVTCSGFYLQAGAIITVAFSTANTYNSRTIYLNVNSTGAKSIYLNNSVTSSANNLLWAANSLLTFIYDGTQFHFISKGVNGGSTWYGTSSTTAGTQAKTSTIPDYFLEKGSLAVIHFSTANTYTGAKITLNINSTGAKDIWYNGSVTSSTNTLTWDANTTVTFMYDGTEYVYVTSSKGGKVSDIQIGGTSILSNGVANIVTNSTYNSSSNKIATMSDVPSVTSTYSSTGTTAVTGTAVNAALQTLDSSISATTNQAISAITITDGKISNSSKIDVTPKLNWYGTSTTNATTQAKVVTCSNYALNTHNLITINFSYANTYTSAKITLNVNSTGAKDIYYKGAVTSSTNTLLWDAGDQLTFIYDGSYYRFVSKDTNLFPLTIRTWS